MNSIVHFEIPADDVERAKKFYEKIFGWKIEKFPMPEGDDYFSVYAKDKEKGVGIDGGMMKRKNAGQPFMNYVAVDSIDTLLKKIKSATYQWFRPRYMTWHKNKSEHPRD